MVISSRTPEGDPGRCPICGAVIKIEPSEPTRDAPCPCCGHLNWLCGKAPDVLPVVRSDCTVLGPDPIESLMDSDSDPARSSKLVLRDLHPALREVFPISDPDPIFKIEA